MNAHYCRSGGKNPLQYTESVAFPFDINTSCMFPLPGLLCKPTSMHRLLYAHFTAHDLLESPDEAKWKRVQQSYDWGRRNHPHCNRSHTKTLCHRLARHFTHTGDTLQCKGRSKVTFQPQNQLPLKTHVCFFPDALCALKSNLTNCAVFCVDFF